MWGHLSYPNATLASHTVIGKTWTYPISVNVIRTLIFQSQYSKIYGATSNIAKTSAICNFYNTHETQTLTGYACLCFAIGTI